MNDWLAFRLVWVGLAVMLTSFVGGIVSFRHGWIVAWVTGLASMLVGVSYFVIENYRM